MQQISSVKSTYLLKFQGKYDVMNKFSYLIPNYTKSYYTYFYYGIKEL